MCVLDRLPFEKDLGHRSSFLLVSRKTLLFSKKLFNDEIFGTEFVIRRLGLDFCPKTSSFLRRWSNAPSKQFFAVFSKNTAFFEKLI